jgi:hypothetical protein
VFVSFSRRHFPLMFGRFAGFGLRAAGIGLCGFGDRPGQYDGRHGYGQKH